MITQRYVAGFAFNPAGNVVLLVKKLKPTWQAGRYNAIGGKIENGESAIQTMRREFHEETGLLTRTEAWRRFAVLHGGNTIDYVAGTEPGGPALRHQQVYQEWEVHFFVTWLTVEELQRAVTVEQEQIVRVDVHFVTSANSIPNLPWLLAMAANMDKDLHRPVDEYTIHEQYGVGV